MSRIKALIGLGNPAVKYDKTYHNLGQFIAKKLKDKINLTIITPEAYMNVSGQTVIKEMKKFKVRKDEILIAYDDSDLEFGKIRFYFDGSSAGHKGIESVATALKTNKFWRMRIGSRTNHNKEKQALDFALDKLKPNEIKTIEENINVITEEIEKFIMKPEKFTFRFF